MLLSIIFIDDLAFAIAISIIIKFADDTKVGNCIRSDSDIEALQQCIDNIVQVVD